jgi:hypothetical protein
MRDVEKVMESDAACYLFRRGTGWKVTAESTFRATAANAWRGVLVVNMRV